MVLFEWLSWITGKDGGVLTTKDICGFSEIDLQLIQTNDLPEFVMINDDHPIIDQIILVN